MMPFSIALDLFPFTAALLASIVCALLGNFLVLRRLSLMGDAISHSVLPGLVVAFLITAERTSTAMMIGAALAGIATVILVELVKKLGRVEPGAAMGVVFSVLFALGVLLIEQAARQTDLDADCVLHGNLEALVWWDAPPTFAGLWSVDTHEAIPRQIELLLAVTAIAVAFVTVCFKELRIAAFDPALSTTQGIHAGAMHYALMILVAAATVASFEAVGSILVIAMLVCPASTARLLTDRLRTQIFISIAIATLATLLGYAAATAIPALFDKDSVSAAGSIAVASGALLAAAAIFSPSHGALARAIRHRRVAQDVALDDLLAALYRLNERSTEKPTTHAIQTTFGITIRTRTLEHAKHKSLLQEIAGTLALTPSGTRRAEEVVRRHRLWEHYLVDTAGFAPDHVHDTAETLEHTPLAPPTTTTTDPHGRPIPPVP